MTGMGPTAERCLDQIEPALDQDDIAGDSIDPGGETRVLPFKQTHSLLEFRQVRLDLYEVATDCAKHFRDKSATLIAHALYPVMCLR
jgi:hypothetical protein